MSKKFKILFFGTPKFVLPVLDFLYEKEDLQGVVTQPDKPQGRGLEILPSPVKKWALERGIPVFEPKKLKDPTFLEILQGILPELIIVFAYGKILPPEVLGIPKEGCWNIHLSLLPKYRGASPVQWAILQGESETGITIMLMDEGMDTGPILLQKRIAIAEDDTTATLLEKLALLAVTTLEETLRLYKEGKIKAQPQPEIGVSYAPLLKKEDGYVTFKEEASKIVNKIRAFTPWPGVFTTFRGKLLKIISAKALPSIEASEPGKIIKISKEGIEVSTSQGNLLLKEVQLEGRRKVSAYDFAQGFHLKSGTLWES